jgi:maltooligosyltrehalose trehalohydrolase
VNGLSAHHFIGFIQNHDQVGNRAKGDRLEHIVGMVRAKIGIAIVLMSPFIPLIFQGEEFAASSPFQYFADHDEPAMADAVREGRKREFAAFGWNPDEIPGPDETETFERSKLNWDEIQDGRHEEMLEWVRQLIHLRRHTSCLNDGDLNHLKVKFDEEKQWLTMDRGQVRILCNLGREAVGLENHEGFSPVLSTHNDIEIAGDKVMLPPDSLVVLCARSE